MQVIDTDHRNLSVVVETMVGAAISPNETPGMAHHLGIAGHPVIPYELTRRHLDSKFGVGYHRVSKAAPDQ
jgi:hypothetical protein